MHRSTVFVFLFLIVDVVKCYEFQESRDDDNLGELMQFFGQRMKLPLATLYWSQPCNVTHHEALSALSRAKTDECRKEITSISCLNEQNNGLFPDFIPKYNKNKTNRSRHLRNCC